MVEVRAGGSQDAELVLAMGDGAVAWLAAQGRTGQWGTTPWSTDPRRIDRVGQMAAAGGLYLAEVDGMAAGTLSVTEHPSEHIPPVDEPELYVELLLTAREFTGRGVGGALLAYARRLAGDRLLRVDCYAGDDGRLVAYYVSQGFTPTETFSVGAWPGQVLELRPTVS